MSLLLEKTAKDCGAFFEKGSIFGRECVDGVAVDVDFADDFAVRADGNDDL